MKKETRNAVSNILKECVDNTLKRIKKDATHRPFHEALLSKELLMASAFERSFSTSFGQRAVEEISQRIAIDRGAECVRQKETQVNIYKGALDEITRIMGDLREGLKTPDWNAEIKKICAFKKGDTVVQRVISDLWIKNNNHETFISIKTVKPNLDQTEIAKRDLLLLKADDPARNVIFGLFYNPGGEERDDYNWTIPNKIFNMLQDDCVLIGADYWNFIGGRNTYSDLLEIFSEIGESTREQLKRL
jgi:hypothetical protein